MDNQIPPVNRTYKAGANDSVVEGEKITMNTTPPIKRLYRSRTDSKIAGICGGLGLYFDIDPVWIRALFLIGFFVGGSALLVYLVLWIVVPLEPARV
jgi:phage shock protein C